MSKKYFITITTFNIFFYALTFMSAYLELQTVFLNTGYLLMFLLIIVNGPGIILGLKLMEKNPKDKYARLGFIVSVTPLGAIIFYWIFGLFFLPL